ncbi:MAG TPA: glutamine--fructose-6-phosphate transaminase (isomerizing) [Thermoleophilia bacterium]|nr:glutamine--fructose-6-phosphate transaminase (isomerizing) [Thermoleophilia bacterium]
MCGIVGYVGRRPSKPILLDGLRRLEYRGYDSAGLVLVDQDGLDTVHAVGNLDALFLAAGPNGSQAPVGLGHTRWATHGRPSEENAHPHEDCTGRVSIVLNGIVENYKELRAELRGRGHTLHSETDAEVVAHLIEENIADGLAAAVCAILGRIEGYYAFCAVSADQPDIIVGTRKQAPLVVGVGDAEMFFASAIPAFMTHTRTIVILEDGDVATIDADGVTICDVSGRWLERPQSDIAWDDAAAEKGGFETFMLKEIHEQPVALQETLAGRLLADGTVDLGEVGISDEMLRRLRRVFIVACGTSYHAGLVVSYAIEQLARVPVQIDVASEFRYREPVFDPETLVIGITQSGETADTLAAMRLARQTGSPVLAVTNVMGSQASRDADYVLYTRAGLEIGVAATKTHTAQVAAMLLLALRLAWARGMQSEAELKRLGHELRSIPSKVAQLLERDSAVTAVAQRYHDERFFLYLGRGMGFAVCLEGALKLKEISYIPTEAYAAGEMKHGPIALLDEESPVVVVADDSPVFAKLVSNIEEVRARGADIIAVASDDNETIGELSRDVLWVPKSDYHLAPILTVVPLQLLAYHIAVIKGLNVDQPRNLAKTVTVE